MAAVARPATSSLERSPQDLHRGDRLDRRTFRVIWLKSPAQDEVQPDSMLCVLPQFGGQLTAGIADRRHAALVADLAGCRAK